MATLAKLLQVEMGLPEMAKRLAAAGRGKDSILAHINPREAKLLKKHGGSGKTNPATGIMEFDDYEDYGGAPTEVSTPMFQESASAAREPIVNTAPTSNAPLDDRYLPGNFYTRFPQKPVSPFQPIQGQELPSVSTKPSQQAPASIPTGAYDQGIGLDVMGKAPAEQPGFIDRFTSAVQPYAQKAEKLSKALDPFAPYAKFATQAYGAYQGKKASNEAAQRAAVNEEEVKKLADPYRQRAAALQQQAEKLMQQGQAGQLTAPQQQQIEGLRAQAMQQAAQSGQTGGTAEMQTEAQISRVAQQYAQDNINAGIALLNQSNAISGMADKFVTDAIAIGYTQNLDAQKLASEYMAAIGFGLPETQSKAPTQR